MNNLSQTEKECSWIEKFQVENNIHQKLIFFHFVMLFLSLQLKKKIGQSIN